jgi:hypothetical protein
MRIITMFVIYICFSGNALARFDTTIKAELYTKDIAIFPASYTYLIPGSPFTPTHEEIDKAEHALATTLVTLNLQRVNQTSSPVIHRNLNNYKKQYFGFVDSNGNRILLINCIWSKSKAYLAGWLEGRLMVMDGGSYYWNIKFNLTANKLFDLDINGYA